MYLYVTLPRCMSLNIVLDNMHAVSCAPQSHVKPLTYPSFVLYHHLSMWATVFWLRAPREKTRHGRGRAGESEKETSADKRHGALQRKEYQQYEPAAGREESDGAAERRCEAPLCRGPGSYTCMLRTSNSTQQRSIAERCAMGFCKYKDAVALHGEVLPHLRGFLAGAGATAAVHPQSWWVHGGQCARHRTKTKGNAVLLVHGMHGQVGWVAGRMAAHICYQPRPGREYARGNGIRPPKACGSLGATKIGRALRAGARRLDSPGAGLHGGRPWCAAWVALRQRLSGTEAVCFLHQLHCKRRAGHSRERCSVSHDCRKWYVSFSAAFYGSAAAIYLQSLAASKKQSWTWAAGTSAGL